MMTLIDSDHEGHGGGGGAGGNDNSGGDDACDESCRW